jgi:hypothetical protein
MSPLASTTSQRAESESEVGLSPKIHNHEISRLLYLAVCNCQRRWELETLGVTLAITMASLQACG